MRLNAHLASKFMGQVLARKEEEDPPNVSLAQKSSLLASQEEHLAQHLQKHGHTQMMSRLLFNRAGSHSRSWATSLCL